MISFDDVVKEKLPQIPDHRYRKFIIGGSGSGKTKSLLIPTNYQSDIDNIYLCAKDPYKAKYQFLIEKRLEQIVFMIQKLLLNIQAIWLIFIKSMKIVIQIKKVKY